MAESKSAALPLGYAPIPESAIRRPDHSGAGAANQCVASRPTAALQGGVSRRRHDPDAIAILHAHAIGPRQPFDPLDDGGGKLPRRQHRAAALAAWAAEALVDRVDADLGKLTGAIVAGGREVLPELGMRHVALLAVAGAGIEEVGRCRVVAESEALVGDGGKERQRLVLHDQVADRIEDRLALVELDSERRVRAVPDEDVGPGVDGGARKGAGEVGGLGELALGLGGDEARMAIFMAVEVDHDP